MANILILDNNLDSRSYLMTILTDKNHHQLLVADNVKQAIDIINREPLDLIITDILISEMSDLFDKIYRNPKLTHIPIMFYTNYRMENVSVIAMQLDVKYVLSKNSSPELISTMINKALNKENVESFGADRQKTSSPVDLKVDHKFKKNNYLDSSLIDHDHFDQVLQETIPNINDTKQREALLQSWKIFSNNFKSIQDRSTQLISLIEMNIKIFQETSTEDTLKTFCKSARYILGSKHCVLGVNHDTSDFKHYYVCGAGSIIKDNVSAPIIRNNFLKNWAKNKKYVLIDNLEVHSKDDLPPDLPNATSLLGFPIEYSGDLYGYLYFTDKLDASKFNDLDIRIGTMISLEIGMLYASKVEA